MSKNCYNQQLLGNFENDNLPKLGELKFRIINNNNSNVMPFWLETSSPFDVKIIGNGHLYQGTLDDQQNITTSLSNVTTTADYRLSPGDYEVSIAPKYKLTRFTLNSLAVANCNIILNIDTFAYSEGLMNINFVGSPDNEIDISGNIDSLKAGCNLGAKYTKLTGSTAKYGTFKFSKSNTVIFASKYITGSLEDFVENLNSVNYDATLQFDIFTENKIKLNNTLVTFTYFKLVVDASGNTVVKNYSNVTLATYTKATNTWVY